MILAKRVFEKRLYPEGGEVWVGGKMVDRCGKFKRLLREWFLLPPEISRITASLHSHPSANRLSGRVGRYGWPYIRFPFKREARKFYFFIHSGLDRAIEPSMGKAVYLQIEYEE